MRTALLIAATAFLSVAGTPASAQTGTSRTVHTADLDLASPSGKAVLRYRIGRAIEGVCGSYATVENDRQDAITACRTAAAADIAAKIAARRPVTTLASAK